MSGIPALIISLRLCEGMNLVPPEQWDRLQQALKTPEGTREIRLISTPYGTGFSALRPKKAS